MFVGTSGAEAEICCPCSNPSLRSHDFRPANTSYFTIYCRGRRRGTTKNFLSWSVYLLPLNALMLFMLHASEHPKAGSELKKTVFKCVYTYTHTPLYVYRCIFVCILFPLEEQDSSESRKTVDWLQDQSISKGRSGKKISRMEERNTAHTLFCFPCSVLGVWYIFSFVCLLCFVFG